MRKKRIVVKQDDIDCGERGSFDKCPITFAVERAWRTRRTEKPVAVRYEGVFVGDLIDPCLWIAELPREAKRFIERFDAGKPVKPTAFDLVFK